MSKKEERIYIRITKEEKEKFKILCDIEGTTISKFLRKVINDCIAKECSNG